jgi:hypothetical protein
MNGSVCRRINDAPRTDQGWNSFVLTQTFRIVKGIHFNLQLSSETSVWSNSRKLRRTFAINQNTDIQDRYLVFLENFLRDHIVSSDSNLLHTNLGFAHTEIAVPGCW